MEESEAFALEWCGIELIIEAIDIERIHSIYQLKLQEKADKGKGKAPAIEENIPSLNPEALERINEVSSQVAIERSLVDLHHGPSEQPLNLANDFLDALIESNNKEPTSIANESNTIDAPVHEPGMVEKQPTVDGENLVDVVVEEDENSNGEEVLVEIDVNQEEENEGLNEGCDVEANDNGRNQEEDNEENSVENVDTFIKKTVEIETQTEKNLTHTLMTLLKSMKEEKVLSEKMHQGRHINQMKLIHSQETRINKMGIELVQMAARIQLLKSFSQHTNVMINTVKSKQEDDSKAISFLVDNAKRGIRKTQSNLPKYVSSTIAEREWQSWWQWKRCSNWLCSV
nr:CTTNBP2 N-terminal-like protein [Ipomoea batatas]